ncbi:MAG: patatin-like phospholipase family protein [Deltaproteobacteria bacterium]
MTVNRLFKPRPFKLGLALSGGGIKGLCHAGVLKALEEHDIKPELISGVSAGAVVGALYADGYSPDEIGSLFEDMRFRQMTKLRIPDGGIFSIEAFENFMKRNLRAKSFEDLKIPLKIVATNLDKGELKIFESGDLIGPVIASCSIPVLFTPKNIDGINYVDGGVLKNFPVSVIREDCDKIIGVNASPLVADEYKLSVINVATRSYHFMLKANILPDKEICDFLIEPVDMGNYSTFEVEKGREIFELGYTSTKKLLEERMLYKQSNDINIYA